MKTTELVRATTKKTKTLRETEKVQDIRSNLSTIKYKHYNNKRIIGDLPFQTSV